MGGAAPGHLSEMSSQVRQDASVQPLGQQAAHLFCMSFRNRVCTYT